MLSHQGRDARCSIGRGRGVGWIAAAALVLAGCPHPQSKYNDFVSRSPVVDASGIGLDGGGAGLFDVSGTFLLAVATTVAPDRPLQLIATTSLTMNGDGTATLNLSAQPLTVNTRMPVGTPIVAMPAQVDSTGRFVMSFGTVMVPGAANPISGSEITANLTLLGRIASADRFCGDVMGSVTAPITIDLNGSQFGAIRVQPGQTGGQLPAPDVSCSIAAVDGGAPLDGGASDGGLPDAATDLGPADASIPDASPRG